MIERVANRHDNTTEILVRHYKCLVVDPYAVNLIDDGPRKGQARLSFYSAFITNAAYELYKAGNVDNIILFSDASFGDETKSTGDLMKQALTASRKDQQSVPEDRIVLFDDKNLNSTPSQVKRLAEYFKQNGINPEEVLYLTWDYHMERVRNHLEGYNLGVKTFSAVKVHKHFSPDFNLNKLDEVLPYEAIEKMEGFRRKLSRFDKKGYIPLILKPVLGGSFTLDNQREGEQLRFMYMSGRKRLQEVTANR